MQSNLNRAAATRYARALLEVALSKKNEKQILSDLSLVKEAYEQTGLSQILESPVLSLEEKQNIVADLFSSLQEVSLNFLYVVVEAARSAALPAICDQFEKQLLERVGAVSAEVTSAFVLEREQFAEVQQVFDELVGLKVHFKENVDPGLLGGIVVRIGDKVYDGSLRSKLERFGQEVTA